MKATTKTENYALNSKLAVNTEELMALLSCGRATAVEIGTQACSRIMIVRRVLLNLDKIRDYLSSISA